MGTQPSVERIDESSVRAVVQRALEEDGAWRDATTSLLGEVATVPGTGRFRAEESIVVAGLAVAASAFTQLDPTCQLSTDFAEGDQVPAGCVIAVVRGPARALLGAERVALNFMQRLCAIATQTRTAVDAVRGTSALITDTRKTTPGLRVLEKYAVRAGGGVNHRFSLADAVLWKDNHWAMLHATGRSLADVLAMVPAQVPVIVEVENETQLDAALSAGVRRILVDNQPPAQVAAWAQKAGPDVAIEASGGITPARARDYAEAGARFISMGSLTHSVRAASITFEVRVDR